MAGQEDKTLSISDRLDLLEAKTETHTKLLNEIRKNCGEIQKSNDELNKRCGEMNKSCDEIGKNCDEIADRIRAMNEVVAKAIRKRKRGLW
jgi:DNA-binding ferritin-like protein